MILIVISELILNFHFSTSNLTPQTSAEASWSDFFPLKTDNNKNSNENKNVNDFGIVLMDFINQVNIVDLVYMARVKINLHENFLQLS
jgi:hypothetical protein